MNKFIFGVNKNVRLTKSEYNELIKIYGRDVVVDYISRLDDFIKSSGRDYASHFETIKEWTAKDGQAAVVVDEAISEIPEDSIMEILRAEFHNEHCNKCGKRMEFVNFVEKVEGKRPDGRYKCECGVTAQEKEGVLIYGNFN